MKYRIIEEGGEYAIERRNWLLKRERLDMRDGSYWWSEKASYFFSTCWTDDLPKVERIYARLIGDVTEIVSA